MAGYICGFYYAVPSNDRYTRPTRHFLPQVNLRAHTQILATTSRTTLTQTFINPSDKKGIKEIRYAFPLYDGVSVVGFTCHVGTRTITGAVKKKEKAREVYKETVARGETAGLLEQLPDASDVFSTTVGNIPPGAKVLVEITYLGELKHDAGVDGIRFTIPTSIAPRYGNYPGELCGGVAGATTLSGGSGIEITVDAMMSEESFIKQINSPSHPIAINMGTLSTAQDADPQMHKASATLTLGTAELDKDFVLQVVAKESEKPKALLESHPTIPHQRALMTTLVPKFALPPSRPEIVFICDRSGSMSGTAIKTLVLALKVFLKSLPVGIKFNICSFGSKHSFLWDKSQAYNQANLDQAIAHVETFGANFGGTEMYSPLQDTLQRRYRDMSLEVFLVTDGEVWHQQTLFDLLNKEIQVEKAPVRVFTLGIGNAVSHALIEGLARSGNGFSQTVGINENMDGKVVRMLKAALSPHITDYRLEVKYAEPDQMTDENDFEIVEKVADSLKVTLDFSKEAEGEEKKAAISLFDTSAHPDAETPPSCDADGQGRYAHLPTLSAPEILQAPLNIPTLFPFTRTTVYLLLSPSTSQKTPTSAVLRATSPHGPLELEMPVEVLDHPAQTIHQLAAKKAIAELEEGRGWIAEAKDESGKLIKDAHEGRFAEMVEREAVRLGVDFQVWGKWCSFVAVEERSGDEKEKTGEPQVEYLDQLDPIQLASFSSTTEQMRQNIGRVTERGARLDTLSTRNRSAQFKTSYGDGAPRSRGLFGNVSKPRSGAVPESLSMLGGSHQESTGARCFAPPRPRFKSDVGPAAMEGETESCSNIHVGAQSASSGGVFGWPSTGALSASSTRGSAPGSGGNVSVFGASSASAQPGSGNGFGTASDNSDLKLSSSPHEASSGGGGLFGNRSGPHRAAARPPPQAGFCPFRAQAPAPTSNNPCVEDTSPKVDATAVAQSQKEMQAAASMPLADEEDVEAEMEIEEDKDEAMGTNLFAAPKNGNAPLAPASQTTLSDPTRPSEQKQLQDPLHALVGLQTFEGAWELQPGLLRIVGLSEDKVEGLKRKCGDERIVATVLAIAYFEGKMGERRESWELVVEKARGWLEEVGVGDVEGFVGLAGGLFSSAIGRHGAFGDARTDFLR